MKATDQIEFKALNRIIDKAREIDDIHGWIDYFIAPVFVTIILLTVYAIKGVYPFGLNTIAYYDMPTNGVAGYSLLYDVLFGKSGFYLDWSSGLGASLATGGSHFFPINWFFFGVSRDGILFALSFFLMIKLELIAFSMSFYIKKNFGNTIITVCSGILYSFSGYVLQYYTNIDFLDFVFILPLMVYALERLLKEHKYVLFIILMFFMFTCSIQLMYMLCLYLVIKAYFILKQVPEDIKGKSIRLFVISAILSAMMTSFVLIPVLSTLLSSVRVTDGASGTGGGFDYFEKMKQVYNYFRRQKEFMLYGSEMVLGLLMLIVFQGKSVIKKYADSIAMICLLSIPIIHEGINLIWHIGSYKHFPMRFGYMISFECLILLGRYFKDNDCVSIKYVSRASKLIATASIPFIGYILYIFFIEFTDNGIGDLSAYHTYWLYFITLIFTYFLVFLIDSKRTQMSMLFLLALIQGFCGAYGLIAPDSAGIDKYRIGYVLNSIELRNEFGGQINKTDRVKMDPLYYDPNDSMIVGQPTISYWSYGINGGTEKELQNNMGYDGMPTCVLDSGGTVFSDALLGVKYAASCDTIDEVLYTKDSNRNSIYECNYTMPFGLIIKNKTIDKDSRGFAYHNYLFSAVTGINDELISVSQADDLVDYIEEMSEEDVKKMNEIIIKYGPKDAYVLPENDANSSLVNVSDMAAGDDESSNEGNGTEENNESLKKYSINITPSNKVTAYLLAKEDFANNMIVMVDGKPIYLNSFESYGHYDYPNDIMKGILALKSIDSNSMMIDIYTTNKDLKGVEIGLLDLDLLSKGIKNVKMNQDFVINCGKRNMSVKGKAYQSGTLFLPIGFSDNWSAKMNGKRIEVKPYINDAFLAVEVSEGDVDIEFSYLPKGLISGVVLSIIGLILVITLIIFEKKGGLRGKKYEPIIDKIFVYGFNAVVAVLFIVMYIVPMWIKISL